MAPVPDPNDPDAYWSERASYNPGRGFSRNRRSQGVWVGRPELNINPMQYDRMKVRPTTVPRGDRNETRFGMALAIAGKEYYNYRKSGGVSGVAERMAAGGEGFARGYGPDLRNASAPDPATRGDVFSAPDPSAGIGGDSSGPAPFDWDKADQMLGTGAQVVGAAVKAGRKVAANPTVQAAGRGALAGAAKKSWAGPAGMLAGAVTGAVSAANRASTESNARVVPEPGPMGSMDPFGP